MIWYCWHMRLRHVRLKHLEIFFFFCKIARLLWSCSRDAILLELWLNMSKWLKGYFNSTLLMLQACFSFWLNHMEKYLKNKEGYHQKKNKTKTKQKKTWNHYVIPNVSTSWLPCRALLHTGVKIQRLISVSFFFYS